LTPLTVKKDRNGKPDFTQTATGLMISTNKPVRIIERKQRELLSVEDKVAPLAKTERQIEREMAQRVAAWIDERREVVKEFARSNGAGGLLRLGINLEGGGG
jgi:hypothetical protein